MTIYQRLHERRPSFPSRFGASRPYLLFRNSYPIDLLLCHTAAQDERNPAFNQHLGGIGIGVVGVLAALADKLSLREPVVLVSKAALAALLRRMVRWHLDTQFASTPGLVLSVKIDLAPARSQNRPIESRLLPNLFTRRFDGPLGTGGHVLNLQRLKDK